MNPRMRINRAIERSYNVACESSNTLEHADPGHGETLRAGLIDETVQALDGDGVPRLGSSLALL